MPAIKIELKQGIEKNKLLKIRDTVLDSTIEALKLPSDDRNIRIIKYNADLFQMRYPYEILIEICMFSGRTKETKKKLFQAIVNSLESNQLARKEQVFIIINEQPFENWGLRGGIPADEIDMAFEVNI